MGKFSLAYLFIFSIDPFEKSAFSLLDLQVQAKRYMPTCRNIGFLYHPFSFKRSRFWASGKNGNFIPNMPQNLFPVNMDLQFAQNEAGRQDSAKVLTVLDRAGILRHQSYKGI